MNDTDTRHYDDCAWLEDPNIDCLCAERAEDDRYDFYYSEWRDRG